MGIFKNPFNSDKKYYLELDEVQDSKAVKAATEVANTVKEKVEAVVETAKEEVTSVATEEKPEEAKPVAAKAKAKKPTGKSKQNGKTTKSATTTTQSPKVTAKSSGASSYDPPFWVAAMYNSNGSGASGNGGASNNGAAKSETFATDNLMPTITNYRRRPGGSLNKFKDMAKNVRTGRR